MSYRDAEFKAAEMKVAAFSPLTAEEGRALYAGFVKERLIANEAVKTANEENVENSHLRLTNARLRIAMERLAKDGDNTCVGLGCAQLAKETLAACDDSNHYNSDQDVTEKKS